MKPYLVLFATVIALLLIVPAVIGWMLPHAAATAVPVTEAPTAEMTAASTQTTTAPTTALTTTVTTAAPTETTTAGAVSLRIRNSDGSGVGTVSVRDYVIFSLAAELSPKAPAEALKACAVAIYTDADRLRLTAQAAQAPADLSETALPFPEGYTVAYWQPQWGDEFDANYAALTAAADAVAGQRMLYDGAPIIAARHERNAGETLSAATVWGQDLPYLQAVASPADLLTAGQPSGDGVGMSRTGACALAEQGLSYREILLYYYRGIQL